MRYPPPSAVGMRYNLSTCRLPLPLTFSASMRMPYDLRLAYAVRFGTSQRLGGMAISPSGYRNQLVLTPLAGTSTRGW